MRCRYTRQCPLQAHLFPDSVAVGWHESRGWTHASARWAAETVEEATQLFGGVPSWDVAVSGGDRDLFRDHAHSFKMSSLSRNHAHSFSEPIDSRADGSHRTDFRTKSHCAPVSGSRLRSLLWSTSGTYAALQLLHARRRAERRA